MISLREFYIVRQNKFVFVLSPGKFIKYLILIGMHIYLRHGKVLYLLREPFLFVWVMFVTN
jgi:hypothetical protein